MSRDGHIRDNCCVSKKGHVKIVLEPKANENIVLPTPPSKGEPTQALSKDEASQLPIRVY